VKTQRIGAALCVGLLLHLLSNQHARGGQWQTIVVDQATNDAWPQVSGGRVAWTGGYGNDSEIFLYENGVTKQLTNDHLRDSLIGITGNHIAWSEYVPSPNGHDTVNLVLDGKTVAQGLPYDNVSLSSGGLAWALGTNVNFYDGSTTHTFVYPGASLNNNPNASGSRVVWSGFDSGGNNRAYMYDGSQVVQLPDGVNPGQSPHISGDYVTGILVNDSDYIMGVTRYNIASAQLDTFPSEIRYSNTPYIAGEQMTWVSEIGGTAQVFALNSHGVPVQLTDSGYKWGPQISESFVAWSGPDSDSGIFTFDGNSISRVLAAAPFSQVTDADKNTLVWLQPDGPTYDIVLGTYTVPEPGSVALAGVAVVSFSQIGRRRRRSTLDRHRTS
jgi:hypothetical protein